MTLPIGALLLGALMGAAVGAIYLWLLWVAVHALPRDGSGVIIFVGFGLVRVAVLLSALAAAGAFGLRAPGIAAAVGGFIAVRFAATRWIGRGAPGDAIWK